MTSPVWTFLHSHMTMEQLGFLPYFLSEDNPASAAEQLDVNYRHGGGWRPVPGFELAADNTLTFPGDPPYRPLALTKLRDETVVFYAYAFVAIIQPDRSFAVARMD